MKKYITTILFLIAVMACTACIGSGQEETTTVQEEVKVLPGGGTTTVYVIAKNKKDEISRKELAGAGKVAEQAGYIVKVGYYKEDIEKQVKWMEKAIEEKSAAILCHKTDNNEMDNSIKKAEEAGIPVFFIKDTTGSEEAEKAGKEAGQQAVDYLNK